MPELVNGRDKEIIIICRSGLRSVLGTQMLQMMGFNNICSMKTGLRGWNDYELPLYDLEQNQLDPDDVDEMLSAGFCSKFMHPDQRTIHA
jgi:3-mercaptopyruvate sulfurtransferase SseA